MKVSVITIVYNDAEVIAETLETVHAQSDADIEHIVVDGGSTDGTCDIIDRYRERVDLLISEPDDGIYDAMNKGAACAAGSYLIFMNAGDLFYSDSAVADFVSAKHDADIVYGDALLRLPDGRVCLYRGELENIFKKMPFSHQSCFIRTEVQNRLMFDLCFTISADYDFMLRAYRQKCRFQRIDQIVATHGMDGISNQKRFRSSIESLHALLNYDPDMDHSDTDYYTRHILQGLLHIDNGKMLERFIASMIACRQTPLTSRPIMKMKHGMRLMADFTNMYLNRSK